jgi:hypothetical protein
VWIPAAPHVFSFQTSAQTGNDWQPSETATIGARSFALVDLGP